MSKGAHAALGILRLTWKTCLPKCVYVKELLRTPLFILHRPLCSSQLVPPLASPAQSIQHGGRELTLQSLAEMGFSESQAEMVYDTASKFKHNVPVLTVLFSLGLNPESVLKILEKCPELYSFKEAQLQQRVVTLRKLGLLEGSLQRVISHYPQILSLPVKRVNAVSRLLREKCQFTALQVADILRDSPHVVEEEPARLEYMFQYVYFRMGCRQIDMVKAKLFRLSLEELQCRHSFLERRGLFQTPDKKGQTLILNPRLKDLLGVSQDVYLANIAKATQKEFEVFQTLVAREQKEEEQGEVYSSDEEKDDDDEVLEKHISFNSCYKKETN